MSESESVIVNTEAVQVRRSPKYGTLMTLGAGIGVLVAVVASVSQPASAGYGIGQIIGFLALIFGAIGVGLGAIVALALDRAFSRKVETVEAKRFTVEPVDQQDPSATI